MSDGVIEIEKHGHRWAWSVAYPAVRMSLGYMEGSSHPMADIGVKIDGQPYTRVALGYGWTQNRAIRKAARWERRYEARKATARAEVATHEVVRERP